MPTHVRFHQTAIYVGGKMFRPGDSCVRSVLSVEYLRVQRILVLAIAPHAHGRLLLDRNRQHVPIVVIGVFAQKIDAAGCMGHHFRRAAKD